MDFCPGIPVFFRTAPPPLKCLPVRESLCFSGRPAITIRKMIFNGYVITLLPVTIYEKRPTNLLVGPFCINMQSDYLDALIAA